MFERAHRNRRAAIAAALLLTPSTLHANAWSILGYDGESMGKGGALTANATGPAAVYYNPAGLASTRSNASVISYLHGQPFLNIDVDPNPDMLDFAGFSQATDAEITDACGTLDSSDTCVEDFRRYNDYLLRAAGIGGPAGSEGVVGAYQRINAEMIDRAENPKSLDGFTLGFASPLTAAGGAALAIGGSVFLPLGGIAHQRLRGPTTPYFLQYDDGPHRLSVDLGGAIQLYDDLRLGLGVDILVDISAGVEASAILPAELRLGSVVNPNPNVADIGLVVAGDVDIPLRWGFVAGAQYTVADAVDLGFTFRDKQEIRLDVASVLVLESPFGPEQVPVNIKSRARFRPRELAGGVAWAINENWEISTDLVWKQWSHYRPEIAIEADISTAGLSAGLCDLVNTFSDLQEILDLAGDVVNLGPDEICPFIEDQIAELGLEDLEIYDFDKNKLRNTFNPGLGVTWTGAPWTISAGYRFEQNPVPLQSGLFSIIDTDTHIYGTSIDAEVLSFARIGVYAQYRQLKKTVVQKSRPRLLTQSGNADALPDLDDSPANGPNGEFETAHPRLQELADYVDGEQILSAGYPGYTVSGGYLSAGVQLTIFFDAF